VQHRVWAPTSVVLGHRRFECLYVTAFVEPVSLKRDQAFVRDDPAASARETGAGRDRIMLLVRRRLAHRAGARRARRDDIAQAAQQASNDRTFGARDQFSGSFDSISMPKPRSPT
jgi:hypothetical protein